MLEHRREEWRLQLKLSVVLQVLIVQRKPNLGQLVVFDEPRPWLHHVVHVLELLDMRPCAIINGSFSEQRVRNVLLMLIACKVDCRLEVERPARVVRLLRLIRRYRAPLRLQPLIATCAMRIGLVPAKRLVEVNCCALAPCLEVHTCLGETLLLVGVILLFLVVDLGPRVSLDVLQVFNLKPLRLARVEYRLQFQALLEQLVDFVIDWHLVIPESPHSTRPQVVLHV